MYQSLTSLFYDGVRPSFEEYIIATSRRVAGDGSLLRPARTAVDILFHFGEHYKTEKDDKFTPIHIEALCPGYKLLGNFVDAVKHHTINRRNPQISTASQISEAMRITIFRDSAGLYMNHEVLTIATLDSGKEVDVLEVMSKVINFWGKQLHEDGIMSFRYVHNFVGERVIPRNDVLSPVELKATVGIPISVKVIGRQYDYQKNEFQDAEIKIG